jgi:sulfur carrier protein ThiS
MVELAANTVQIQVYSWISETLGTGDNQHQKLSRKVRPGTTVYDLFAGLANDFPEFREKIFNPDTGKFSDQVLVILNSRLVQSQDFANTIINDKDHLSLSPVLVGG